MSVTALILAAGASTRMGRPKALLPVDNTTFLGRIATTARQAGVQAVSAVLGPPDGTAIKARLPVGVGVIWNPDPSRGMLSSIQAGIASLPPRTVAMLLWPVDHPLVATATVQAVLTAQPGKIIVPRVGGRGGHPVRIPRAHFAAIAGLPGDASLRDYIEAHKNDVVHVEVTDEAALRDIDTPDDLARLTAPASAKPAATEKRP